MDGHIPHPDQDRIRIFRNGTFHHLELHSSTEKNPASNVKVWVEVLASRFFLGKPSRSALFFFAFWGRRFQPEKKFVYKLGFSKGGGVDLGELFS